MENEIPCWIFFKKRYFIILCLAIVEKQRKKKNLLVFNILLDFNTISARYQYKAFNPAPVDKCALMYNLN